MRRSCFHRKAFVPFNCLCPLVLVQTQQTFRRLVVDPTDGIKKFGGIRVAFLEIGTKYFSDKTISKVWNVQLVQTAAKMFLIFHRCPTTTNNFYQCLTILTRTDTPLRLEGSSKHDPCLVFNLKNSIKNLLQHDKVLCSFSRPLLFVECLLGSLSEYNLCSSPGSWLAC